MEYEDLIELNQAGEISDLEFLLAQEGERAQQSTGYKMVS